MKIIKYTKEELKAFGELCRDSEKDRIIKLIDEEIQSENMMDEQTMYLFRRELKARIEGK